MECKYITPAVTVFNSDMSLDLEGQGRLFEYLITGGIDGIVILGSIGEFFALTMEQKKELIDFSVKYINNRVKLIVGTASMIFHEVISLSNYAISKGANAVMIIPPYYFTLTNKSIEDYYDRIADNVDGDIYLYNFPDRTGYDLSISATLNLLKRHKNLIGYKDTLAGMDHTRELIKAVKPLYPNFEIYSGFDDNFAHNVLSGGNGCIGGLSNAYPKLFHNWVNAFRNNDIKEVAIIQQKVNKLMDIYGVGTPFVPYIKKVLEIMGLGISPVATVPLPNVSEEDVALLHEILQSYQ